MLNRILGKDLARYVKAHRGLLITSLVLTGVSVLFMVIPVYLIQPFIDEGMKTGTDPVTWKIPWVMNQLDGGFSWKRTEIVLLDQVSSNRLVAVLGAIAFFFMLLRSLLSYLSELASAAFSNRARRSARLDLFEKFVSLPERVSLRLLADVMPQQALELVEKNVTQILRALQKKNFRLMVLSALLALWPASGGMRSVIVTLNRAYNVREGRGPWRVYAVSLVITLALCITLLVAVPMLSFASSIRHQIFETHGANWAMAYHWASRAAAAAALVFGIEFIYHIAPNARRPWHWITPGSIVAVIVWFTAT